MANSDARPDEYSHSLDDETLPIIIPSVITPFRSPKVMDLPMFKGEHKESLYWGTYRPQAYFGVRTRDPHPLVAGLMWLVPREGKHVMRHFCEDKDGLTSFGWKEHNGIDYGQQILVETDLRLETSFVKSKVGNLGYGGDWSVRIKVENKAWDDKEKKGVNLFFYIADESGNALKFGFKDSSTLVYGSHADVGNWQLHLKSETPDLKIHHCGFKTPNSVNLSDLVQNNLDKGKSGELSDTADHHSNLYVFQISSMTQSSTVDIAFISGIDDETDKMEGRTDALTGLSLTTSLKKKHEEFDEKFSKCFSLSEEFDAKTLEVGKAAIANMLGGIGYFYGQSKVHNLLPIHPVLHYWPAELYTAVSCRPKLPWGLLGNEGFHQMLIWRWDFRITLDIVGHWLDLMNELGWIPREQILGAEALSKVEHDHVQYPDVANPPTLLLVLCDLIRGIEKNKFSTGEKGDIVSFLETALVRLEAWFQWLYASQKGKEEGSFYWRGRDSTTDKELNPRTVASGMDDYPRASHPSDDERHVDLRCWIYLAADCMKTITEFLKKKETEYYSSIADKLSNFDDLMEMHYDHNHKTFLDFGNDTEKVRLVIKSGEAVRVTDEEPKLRMVPHVGYASLFPFIMSKIIPPNSQILEEQLDLIFKDDVDLWSNYGLLSLSSTSSLYMKHNALKQPPCWRGPIWMNMNYMILASLKHYSDADGKFKNKARRIYEELRNNLISNVVREYDQTEYIWERYDQTNGTGEGGPDFTGWSSLILLIMTQEYPRL